jgi:transcriptional antiterminator NusG
MPIPGTNPKDKSNERQWYAVHTYSGYEEAVARYLKQRVESLSMEDKIFQIVVPKEKKIKVKSGRRTTTEEKIYPGYVLVDMILGEDSWYVVRNTPRVTGFVGSDNTTPTPLSKEEVDSLLNRMGKEESTYNVDLRAGDLVKITDGPFKDYDGKVSEVDEAKGRVRVMVPIFGRDTAVDLDSLQVRKI